MLSGYDRTLKIVMRLRLVTLVRFRAGAGCHGRIVLHYSQGVFPERGHGAGHRQLRRLRRTYPSTRCGNINMAAAKIVAANTECRGFHVVHWRGRIDGGGKQRKDIHAFEAPLGASAECRRDHSGTAPETGARCPASMFFCRIPPLIRIGGHVHQIAVSIQPAGYRTRRSCIIGRRF